MAPPRRSGRHASVGTPTSAAASPATGLMGSHDAALGFGLKDGDGDLLGLPSGLEDIGTGLHDLTGDDLLPGSGSQQFGSLSAMLDLDDLDMHAFGQNDCNEEALQSVTMQAQPSTIAEDSTESERGDDLEQMYDIAENTNGLEDEDGEGQEDADDADGDEEEDNDDDEEETSDLHDTANSQDGLLHDTTSASSTLKRRREAHSADSSSKFNAKRRRRSVLPDDSQLLTDAETRNDTDADSGSLHRSRSRSSSTLSSAPSESASQSLALNTESVPFDHTEVDINPGEEHRAPAAQTEKEKRDAEELSRLRRGSPDSQFSASASEEDEDDVPLQALIASKTVPTSSTDGEAQTALKGVPPASKSGDTKRPTKGQKGQGHLRKPSTTGHALATSRKVAGSETLPADKSNGAEQPAAKTLGSSRTVPEHQPGTPHADLHNDTARLGPNGEPDGLLDAEELKKAISERVKLEEFATESITTKPLDSTKTMESLIRGQAVDDEEIAHDLKPRERPAQLEERLGIIRFVPVTASSPSITTSILLTGLKNIFQRQLPKMPREYITRLVFDRNHWSMAIVKRHYQVVGGITYRPFDTRGFGEIVFCAITGTEQVRGYGSHLMNHLKDWVKSAHPNVKHFLTYADNYAFGYFKKQGFTKDLTLPRSIWAGYIKDYEGATIMQCTMLPRISYLQASHMLLRQKQLILNKIREKSHSHVVHSGANLFRGRDKVHPSDVEALRAIGWTPDMDALTRRPERGPQHAIMRRLLTDLQNHPASWAFARPVNAEEVTDYYEAIKNPMDLETMENKLNANRYFIPAPEDGHVLTPREGLGLFLKDCQLIFDNCRKYNSDSSNYSKNAEKLRAFLRERLKAYTEDE